MVRVEQGSSDGGGLKVAIVRSRFNDLVTRRLLEGALAALRESGVPEEHVVAIEVPGAIELALGARIAIEKEKADAVVCLGAVIRGETDHYEHVCRMAGDSIARLSLETGVPIAFGVLTCDAIEQALARSGAGGGNRGHDAARVALEMANLKRRYDVPPPAASSRPGA